MVRPRAGESLEDAEQRRQKRRHDPRTQREDAPRNPPRELRPRHRAGKEPAGSSSGKEPRKAPYIMQSRPAAPPTRPTPTSMGIAHDICPKTPPRLRVEYTSEQRNYPSVPRLHRPGIVPGFAVVWKENTTSKMWHLGRHARRKSTNMTRVKVLRGAFGASFTKTSIPQW